jgi:uncharacterized protein
MRAWGCETPIRRPPQAFRLAFAAKNATLKTGRFMGVIMRRILSLCATLLALTGPAHGECKGQNLIDQMSPKAAAALRAQTAEIPFAAGNFWQATKGDQKITLIGTYHIADPRHQATLAALAPALHSATRLLVEAGPNEQESLKARIADDPALIVNADGPTLPEILSKADWDKLKIAVSARGVPAFMAAKFRPWYISILLSMPSCDPLSATIPQGLDQLLIQTALTKNLTVQALEPYDTLFAIFGKLTQAEQLDMITSALALEDHSADMATTLADAYFNQEGRLIWEFSKQQTLQMPGYTPEKVDAEFATMEQAMMIDRNIAWIPVIKAAAAEGPILVAFGALHLSGEKGVLNLLQTEGYTITRLPL